MLLSHSLRHFTTLSLASLGNPCSDQLWRAFIAFRSRVDEDHTFIIVAAAFRLRLCSLPPPTDYFPFRGLYLRSQHTRKAQ